MDVNEQLDRAIGEPSLRVDLDAVVARGRSQHRKRRNLAVAALCASAVALAAGTWSVIDRPDQIDAAEQQAVSISTCTTEQVANWKGGYEETMPFDVEEGTGMVLVSGPAQICVSPQVKVLEQLNAPIEGHTSVALRVKGLEVDDSVEGNVLVVWGGYGLDNSWPTVQLDADWVNGTAPEPLATYAQRVNDSGLSPAPDRESGWRHCPELPDSTPLQWRDGAICVADGFEVLDHATGDQLGEELLDEWGDELSNEQRQQLRDGLAEAGKLTAWDLVDKSGRQYVAVTDELGKVNESFVSPWRIPLSTVWVMMPGESTFSSSSSGSSSSVPQSASATEVPS